MTNGNIRKILKIMTWNKANGTFDYKLDDIKELISKHKPDIFVVTELNLKKTDFQYITNINNYNFEHDQLLEKNCISRVGMWIKKKLVFKREKKHEVSEDPMVTISVGYPHKRKVLISGIYRQWKRIYDNKEATELSINKQNQIFKKIINVFENIIENYKELVILGDINIDYKIMTKDESQKNGYEKKFNTMIK